MLRFAAIFFVGILISFGPMLPSFGEYGEQSLPDWVLRLHEFWLNEQISDIEFSNAIEYLQDEEIIQMRMQNEYDTITNFLISVSLAENKSTKFSDCSDGWYITGYFTPIESDYTGDVTEIEFDDEKKYYRSDFLATVKTEGWGRTLSGEYLGWYNNSFHLEDTHLDFFGNKLTVQSIAVDPYRILDHTKLLIPTLPTPWDKLIFTALDRGPSIQGKHIDVFTGEGIQAELETERITGEDNKVCKQAGPSWLDILFGK